MSLAKEIPLTELCDENCVEKLKESELITTKSGLQFQDVVTGRGPTTPVGFQARINVSFFKPRSGSSSCGDHESRWNGCG